MTAWKPLETAPEGYDGKKFNRVLFRGWSKTNQKHSYVSGWMDHERKPVHNYRYKLEIDAWTEIPE